MATADRIKKWRENNPEKVLATAKKWHLNNKEKSNAANKNWRESNIEKVKQYRKEHAVKRAEYNKKWALEHSDHRRESDRRRRKENKLSCNIKAKICHSLHGTKGNRHWEILVGYTVDQLKAHLEKKFKPGMTWENYGTYWQIDHKIPIAVFNYQRPEDIDFRLCWSLKNLQPLETKENMHKNKKIDKPFQPSFSYGGMKI